MLNQKEINFLVQVMAVVMENHMEDELEDVMSEIEFKKWASIISKIPEELKS